MKIIVTMKSPDSLSYADEDLQLAHPSSKQKKAYDSLVDKYFEYGEYVYIELDLDKGTATLVQGRDPI